MRRLLRGFSFRGEIYGWIVLEENPSTKDNQKANIMLPIFITCIFLTMMVPAEAFSAFHSQKSPLIDSFTALPSFKY